MVEIKATYPMQNTDFNEMLKIKGEEEKRQSKTIYPSFGKIARKEGFDDIASTYEQIGKIEECHSKVLFELYQKIQNNCLYSNDVETLFKCLNCGHEDKIKKAWKKCPVCNKDQGYVKINLSGNINNNQ